MSDRSRTASTNTGYSDVGYGSNRNGSMVFVGDELSGVPGIASTPVGETVSWKPGAPDPDFSVMKLFCRYTSAHGFKCAASPERSKFIRCLWVAAIVVAVSSLVVALLELKKTYNTYPLKTQINVKHASQVLFPAVTLCNLHPLHYSKVHLLPQVRNAAEKLHKIYLAESVMSESNIEEFLSDPDYNDVFNVSTFTIYKTLGMNIRETLKHCAWNNIKVPCTDIFKLVHLIDGTCYQFNYNSSHPLMTSFTGPRSGLSVLAVHTEHRDFPVEPSGLKVLLHSPGSFPDVAAQGFLVPPGFTTFGIIRVRETKHPQYPYKSYGENYCIPRDPTSDQVGYTRDTCIASCAYSLAENRCNCSEHLTDTEDNINRKDCTLRQTLTCVRPTFAKILLEADVNNKDCQVCKYRCDVTTFTLSTSQTTFPLRQDLRSNYLELRLFYDQMITEEVRYEPEYTWDSILGIVGGHLGLFIGASVLTVLEVIEGICWAIFRFCRTSARRYRKECTTPLREADMDEMKMKTRR